MANNPNPFRDAFPFNNVMIGGVVAPGIVQSIGDPSKPHIWVYQQGLAAWNAVSIWRGQKLAEGFLITMRLCNEEQYDACYPFRDVLQPKLGRSPPVLPILNGMLDFIGVKRVSVKNIIAPKPASGLSWELGIELTEFSPMKKADVGPPDKVPEETEADRLAARVVALKKKASEL
jgi:hypothetical protein